MIRRKPGFTLIELLVVIAIIALLIGILLPALSEARRSARLVIDQSNQRQLSLSSNTYAADFGDDMPSFSWRAGRVHEITVAGERQVFPAAGSPVQASAQQAVANIAKATGNTDIVSQVPSAWIPHILYTHVVLQDYLAERLPEPTVVSTGDVNRLAWQEDPWNYTELGTPLPETPSWRWPFSSSFQFVPAVYNPEQSARGIDGSSTWQRLEPGTSHNNYTTTNTRYAPANMSKVFAPSLKVLLFDSVQRHANTQLFYGNQDARVPVAMVDGSGGIRANREANFPYLFASRVDYTPDPYEPPAVSGAGTDRLQNLKWAFTVGGMNGFDFDGKPRRPNTPDILIGLDPQKWD